MRLDLRILVPTAMLAAALAIPAGTAVADSPNQGHCPDHFMGPFFIGAAVGHDSNDNGFVCVKEEDMHLVFKDDNCNPNCDKNDLTPLAPLIPDAYTDDIP